MGFRETIDNPKGLKAKNSNPWDKKPAKVDTKAVYEKPKSPLAESFRAIRSSLQYLYKKTNTITIVTEDDMRLKAITDSIISRMMKQNLDPKSLDFGKDVAASGNMIRKEIKIKEMNKTKTD